MQRSVHIQLIFYLPADCMAPRGVWQGVYGIIVLPVFCLLSMYIDHTFYLQELLSDICNNAPQEEVHVDVKWESNKEKYNKRTYFLFRPNILNQRSFIELVHLKTLKPIFSQLFMKDKCHSYYCVKTHCLVSHSE